MFRKFRTIFMALVIGAASVTTFFSENYLQTYAADAVWPLDSKYKEVTTFFDENRNYGGSGHNAIDIPADSGSRIYAPADGYCVSAGWMGDYGNLIILRHENLNIYTFYAHCSAFNVYEGQHVSQGDVIGFVGNTGNSYGNHLHFGVCDTLQGGYPAIKYYNPLTFFTYSQTPESIPQEQPVEGCSCSESYAGTYTTYDVTKFLNMRSGHGTGYSIVTEIPAGSEFHVSRADGNWAHVEYGGCSGFCSMDYIQPAKPTQTVKSDMVLNNPIVPKGKITKGNAYSIGGIISSNLPITRVTGGIYKADAATPVYVCEAKPMTLTYNLAEKFDEEMLFNKLNCGTYVYKIEAEDTSGEIYYLTGISFMVVSGDTDIPEAVSPVNPAVSEHAGDLDGDGYVTSSDGEFLSGILLGILPVSDTVKDYADMNGDGVVDVFDMILLRQKYSNG